MVLTAGQEAFDLLCNYSQLTLGSLHYSELNLWHCVVQKGTESHPLVNLNCITQQMSRLLIALSVKASKSTKEQSKAISYD